MVKLRLQRIGRRNDPSFRVVAQDIRSAPSGKALEIVGFYNPRLKQQDIDTEKVKKWLSQGAQATDTVHNLLVSEGVIKSAKRDVVGQRSQQAEEAEQAGENKEAEEEAVAGEKKQKEGGSETEKDTKEKEAAEENDANKTEEEG